ncbi:MAG: hypothetical protein JXA69_08330 [Phycisphaerae bacterium]|nr:hypothetical protein [Phycisphaerae bacterium]
MADPSAPMIAVDADRRMRINSRHAQTVDPDDLHDEIELIEQLANQDPKLRGEAIVHLHEIRHRCCWAFHPLLSMLDDEDSRVRALAALVLCKVVRSPAGYLPPPSERPELLFRAPGWRWKLLRDGPSEDQQKAFACNLRTTAIAMMYLMDDEDQLVRSAAAVSIHELACVSELARFLA